MAHISSFITEQRTHFQDFTDILLNTQLRTNILREQGGIKVLPNSKPEVS